MSIEQSISQAPLGLDSLLPKEGPDMEIQIENPEGVTVNIDGVEIDLMPEDNEEDFDANLAEEMSSGELARVAGDIIGLVDADINSRKDWVEMYVKGLEVLGMKYEERTVLLN